MNKEKNKKEKDWKLKNKMSWKKYYFYQNY